MNYYIKTRTDAEVGDVYPQVDFNKVQEAFKFRHNSFPQDEPLLSAKLTKKAKLTDTVSQASIMGHGLLVNEKVRAIFENLNIINHKYYECPVSYNRTIYQYYWLALAQPDLVNLVDYQNSSFYLKKGLTNMGEITINSFEDYEHLKPTLDVTTIVQISKLVIKENQYDLFVIPYFGIYNYISEKLKILLERENISGIEILHR